MSHSNEMVPQLGPADLDFAAGALLLQFHRPPVLRYRPQCRAKLIQSSVWDHLLHISHWRRSCCFYRHSGGQVPIGRLYWPLLHVLSTDAREFIEIGP